VGIREISQIIYQDMRDNNKKNGIFLIKDIIDANQAEFKHPVAHHNEMRSPL
jgi:hypothetical protein